MAVQLSKPAEAHLCTLTGLPGASGIVPRGLVHHVVGDSASGDAVIAEWISAGHAHETGEDELALTTIPQRAPEDLTGHRRAVGWYTIRAAEADEDTQPYSFRLASHGVPPRHRSRNSAQDATAWFRDHRTLLTAMLNAAYEQGWYDLVLHLAESMWSLHRFTGDHDNELAVQVLSLDAARHLPEKQRSRWLAACHSRAAGALSSLQRRDEALREAEEGLDHAGRTGEPLIVSIALCIRGRALLFAGQPQDALESYQQALTLAEQLDNSRHRALVHRRIGEIQVKLDNLGDAISSYKTAAELMATAGDTVGHARVMSFRARALLAAGDPSAAYATLRPVLPTLEASGCDFWAADANEVLGDAAMHADPSGDAARPYYDAAVEMFERGGEPARAERVRERRAELALP